MSTPIRPFFQSLWQTFTTPVAQPENHARTSATHGYHVPGGFPDSDRDERSVGESDRFQPAPTSNQDEVHLRLAELRSREEHLNDAEAAELCDLNDAQRLQQAYEQGKLADSDVREAVRLASLRKAFATPGKSQPPHSGDQFERKAQPQKQPEKTEAESSQTDKIDPKAVQARLEYLRRREAHLSDNELVELCDMQDAQRLQRDIEQNKLADSEVAEASRLADLRKAFETARQSEQSERHTSQSNNSPSTHRTGSRAESSATPQPMPGTPMSLRELFGRDLTQVTIRQGYPRNNSCYLLSAFDAILNHPQGRRILSLIQVNRVNDGYLVKFPGQPEPIHVSTSDLKDKRLPTSNPLGIRILWNAYFHIPDAEDPQTEDTTTTAMQRIFGDRVASTWDTINTTMAESSQERAIMTQYADLWTATRRNGNHYFSVRPNTDLSFHLVNPFNTSRLGEHFQDQNAFASQFSPELTRIRLTD